MKLVYLDKFTHDFSRLPRNIQKRTAEKLKLFTQNYLHPSLRAKKMSGFDAVWEAHINMQYVFTFALEEDEETGEQIAVLRRIGNARHLQKPIVIRV